MVSEVLLYKGIDVVGELELITPLNPCEDITISLKFAIA